MVTGCGTKFGRVLALGIGLLVAGVLSLGLDSVATAQPKTTKKKETDTKKKETKKVEKEKDVALPAREDATPDNPLVNIPQVKEINRMIEEQWKANNILKPSSQASSFEFARRVSLDIIGRIPKTDELHKFMADPGQSRRGLYIDRLLTPGKDNDEYAENWANIWTTWLMTRSGNKLYHEQMQVWLEEQFAKNAPWNKLVTELLTAEGENDENGAVNFILSHLGEPTPQPKVPEEGAFNYVPITSRTTRLFLGLQTQCTQCHDHPFNPQWKQKHFWGVNAFYRQVVREGNPMMRNNQRGMQPPKLILKDNTKVNATEMVFYETRKAVVLATRASFLDGKKYDPKAGSTRRQQLARYVVDHEMFAKAYVNRMWAHFFGRGMTVNGKDVDDFGEHNAETHPELLNYLAKEFIASGYDSKQLIRWICNSRAYNLTCVANGQVETTVEEEQVSMDGTKKKVQKKVIANNDKPDVEPWFSRMLLKTMTPEQLFNSLWVSTYDNPRSNVKKGKAERDKLREEWMNRLIVNFGDDEGNETTFNGTVIQALMLMNGNEINNAIIDKDGPVESAMRYSRGKITNVMDELYLATLSRRPTADESKKILAAFYPRNGKPAFDGFKEKSPAHPYEDLMWALLNSSEFILNH
jgi:hypothetical protein